MKKRRNAWNSSQREFASLLSYSIRADQNTGGALLEFPMRTAICTGNLAFRLQYLFAIIDNKGSELVLSTVVVAQSVRPWSSGHRVVQTEGSIPGGDTYTKFFSACNDFYFSSVRANGLQCYSDIV